MLDSKRIKEIMFALGADLCGIASIDRFDNAPKGYHPLDALPTCKSVISFGCRFPVGTLNCKSNIPYTRVRNSITSKMDAIVLDFCIEMEKNQIVCVRSSGGLGNNREAFFVNNARVWKYGLVRSSVMRTES